MTFASTSACKANATLQIAAAGTIPHGFVPLTVTGAEAASDHADASAEPTSSALRPLARLAAGRSGADIERLVREARLKARRAGQRLSWDDLVQALGAERLDRPQPLRWRMAVHEAGHALVHLVVGTGRISLISIEAEHGGIVLIEPERHVLETEAWTTAQIVVRLAGRAAEDLVFGDPMAGSGGPPESDLAVATDIAVRLETSLGFGRHQSLLHRTLENRSHMLALDARLAAGVNERLEECYGQAQAILEAERDAHLWLADVLLRDSVLEGDELDGVLREVRQRLHRESGESVGARPNRSSDSASSGHPSPSQPLSTRADAS